MRAINRAEQFVSEEVKALQLALPFSFEQIAVEVGQRPIGFRFSKHIVSIKAQLAGQEILVCGEADDRKTAEAKAVSELIERACLHMHAKTFGARTSNGWAAHPSADQARINAVFELVERDAVLAQWYSSTPFLKIAEEQLPAEILKWVQSELSRSEFPHLIVLLSTMGLGPSVTCMLMNGNGFGVSAHSSRETLTDSIHSAIAEACRAAHSSLRREYWNDTLKLKSGKHGQIDPGAHSLFYSHHEAFPKWMMGDQISWVDAEARWHTEVKSVKNRLSEFAYQPVMNLPLHVGFATHPRAFELIWGVTDLQKVAGSPGAHRMKLETASINGKPHVVA